MTGVIRVTLERDGHDQPWGFRLQGGVDVAMPLSVQRVLVGTPADGVLIKGDIISKISCTDTKGITHQQAADLFNNAGNQIDVYIKR
nr:PDZ and LIM domain protein 3-like [Penaeus vannamei]